MCSLLVRLSTHVKWTFYDKIQLSKTHILCWSLSMQFYADQNDYSMPNVITGEYAKDSDGKGKWELPIAKNTLEKCYPLYFLLSRSYFPTQ